MALRYFRMHARPSFNLVCLKLRLHQKAIGDMSWDNIQLAQLTQLHTNIIDSLKLYSRQLIDNELFAALNLNMYQLRLKRNQTVHAQIN